MFAQSSGKVFPCWSDIAFLTVTKIPEGNNGCGGKTDWAEMVGISREGKQ